MEEIKEYTEDENNEYECNEYELNLLLDIKNSLNDQLSYIERVYNFIVENENINYDKIDSSFIPVFFQKYLNCFDKKLINDEIKLLNNLLIETEKQIKSVCVHNYCEDEIETYNGFTERIQRITYCDKCGSSF
jgi:uncharacterized protein (DUF488 family)